MRMKDFFESEGFQIEDGAAIFSGAENPLTPSTNEAIALFNDASISSIYIRTNGEFWQKKSYGWIKPENVAGLLKRVPSGETLIIEDGYQHIVQITEFAAHGDIIVKGDGELIIHE